MKGKFRQDDCCHWYFIPLELVKEFDTLLNSIYESNYQSYDLLDIFNSKFNEYRCNSPTYYTLEINDENN